MLAAVVSTPGCYLSQATVGQLDLLRRARPIEAVVAASTTSTTTASLLWEVRRIKAFARHRNLAGTDNYERFVDLDRKAAVWVVSACEPLAFTPKTWSFPIAGSFTYLGWFDEQDALTHAAELRAAGLDVYVRGASAYSTLGWFRDPLLSTMLGYGDDAMGDLANVVLHESVHATHYVPGQSTFNESLAQFVGDTLTEEYLRARFGEASVEVEAYAQSELRHARYVARMHQAYGELAKVYEGETSDPEKIETKARIIDVLRADLGTERSLNNAALIQFRTYETGRGSFERLFARCGRKWPRFWRAVRSIAPEAWTSQQPNFEALINALVCQAD